MFYTLYFHRFTETEQLRAGKRQSCSDKSVLTVASDSCFFADGSGI